MKSTTSVLVSATIAAVACAILLGLPATVVGVGPSGAFVGLLLGATLGFSARSGRVQPQTAGAVYGVLTALALGFGYDYGEYGANLLTLRYGGSWFAWLIAGCASTGALLGFSVKAGRTTFGESALWPSGALLVIASAFAWEALVDYLQVDSYWGTELIAACVVAITTHVALCRFYRRAAPREQNIMLGIAWCSWPLLVSLVFSQLWMLNNHGGHHAWDALRGAEMFMIGLLCSVLVSNAAFTALSRRFTEANGLQLLGLFVSVSLVHLASMFLGFSSLGART